MPLGPRAKSELELHWQHQLDHVRADLRDVYRRMQNEAEREAFAVIAAAYQRDGTLLDLHAEPGAIEALAQKSLGA
jgi:uncharacterized protein YigE (DUF2233 family)